MPENNKILGPDFSLGFEISQLAKESITSGHVNGQDAILIRHKDDFYIIDAFCSHYHAPLQDGLVIDNQILCPWHHARFDLNTGAANCAPAFDAVRVWRVEIIDGIAFARERLQRSQKIQPLHEHKLNTIVIIGAGAAGFAAAFTLRAEGYQGNIEMVFADSSPPYDRPNLSKDYLSGNAPNDWLPLRPKEWYSENKITLRPDSLVEKIDPSSKKVTLKGGETICFDRLLLATGAEPIKLMIPGSGIEHIHYLRTLSDSDTIIAASKNVKNAVIIGASFIGLEVAAALRKRGLEIHVVAPEAIPMVRILGPEMGRFILKLHQDHGVIFHLEDSVTEIAPQKLILKSGGAIETNLVIIGVGVKPNLELAEQAGIAVDKGVLVDSYLETSASDIYAAGDIARWPDKLTGENIRVEHWTVAERQGQIAAKNMLGAEEAIDLVPFFWSQHYDQTISYIGHAATWNRSEISGDPVTGNCSVTFYDNDKKLAVATLGRDIQNLCAELSFEKEMAFKK